MNTNFLQVISATLNERRDLFVATSTRLGTPIENVEKDFWVCFILDLLFNGRQATEPRLLFKGGTSLSKAYGLISRFSEDLDVTVFREDIGQTVNSEELEKLSGKQLRIRLNAIKEACRDYIQNALKERLYQQINEIYAKANIKLEQCIIVDPDDPQQQTLLVYYPSVLDHANNYIKPTIKIEGGAKSALDPHCKMSITPYIANELNQTNLVIADVVTIDAQRTFWDKIIILHGLRCWHDKRGMLRQQGHRISRHYYDLYQLCKSEVGQVAKTDYDLALDCARHARLFFNSTDLGLQTAQPGSFKLAPTEEMYTALKRDYEAMAGMIFGEVPEFSVVIGVIRQLEIDINSRSSN
ncbi:nucleotidyl transferase AbiEii/AbiGii toxin family protein [soil metagenome]